MQPGSIVSQTDGNTAFVPAPFAHSALFHYSPEIVFAKDTEETERRDWLSLALSALSNTYGDVEPDYSDAVLLEPNPDFDPS